MEILGLLLVVTELTRVQRQEFGTPMFIEKTTAFVLRLVGSDVLRQSPELEASSARSR